MSYVKGDGEGSDSEASTRIRVKCLLWCTGRIGFHLRVRVCLSGEAEDKIEFQGYSVVGVTLVVTDFMSRGQS